MLSPGPIFNNQKESFVKELVNLIPMKRMGKKEDLISSLKFLFEQEKFIYLRSKYNSRWRKNLLFSFNIQHEKQKICCNNLS